MKRNVKSGYKDAGKTPDEALFTTGDVAKILDYSGISNIKRFDVFLEVKRIRANKTRVYSYNDIEYLKKLKKFIDMKIPFELLENLLAYEKSKGNDPSLFVDSFLNYCTNRKYNKNKKTKKPKAN